MFFTEALADQSRPFYPSPGNDILLPGRQLLGQKCDTKADCQSGHCYPWLDGNGYCIAGESNVLIQAQPASCIATQQSIKEKLIFVKEEQAHGRQVETADTLQTSNIIMK
jgi:hypothetical protein